MEENQEYVLLGKGVGFGKKVSQRLSSGRLYYLQAGSGDRTWLSKRTGKERSTGISGDRR